MKHVLMKCGHAAQAVDEDGNPCCVVCIGIPGAEIVDDSPPDFTGRTARCAYYGSTVKHFGAYRNECDACRHTPTCECERDSSVDLAFFEHKPDKEYDRFYCGCKSWE